MTYEEREKRKLSADSIPLSRLEELQGQQILVEIKHSIKSYVTPMDVKEWKNVHNPLQMCLMLHCTLI